MATKFTLRHPYNIEPDAFWSEVFFDPEYNRKLYLEGLQFQGFDIVEETNPPDGRRTRKVRVHPRFDAPGPIKKMVGDSMSYIEEGRLETLGPNTPRWVSHVTPSTLADKTKIATEFWLERTGPNQSDRVASFEIDVKIFGIGGMFESFLKKTMEENYAKAAEYTNRYLKSRGQGA